MDYTKDDVDIVGINASSVSQCRGIDAALKFGKSSKGELDLGYKSAKSFASTFWECKKRKKIISLSFSRRERKCPSRRQISLPASKDVHERADDTESDEDKAKLEV